MSNIFKLYPTHFSRGGKKFFNGDEAPIGYGPDSCYWEMTFIGVQKAAELSVC